MLLRLVAFDRYALGVFGMGFYDYLHDGGRIISIYTLHLEEIGD